jgi:FlaA1/EpsC-like NDP-sugar epimerase
MSHKTVLVVGSTGSIGHLVVEEVVRQGVRCPRSGTDAV